MTEHKEQHTILEGLTYHGYNGLDNRKKVTLLMYDVKVDSLNTVKSMILANSDFHKDFENCVTLYKELMKQSGNIPSETMWVLEVSSGGSGGSGSKKTEDGYYTKD